jgi:uncharacterized protein YndB with AHSA1/START domain
MREDGTMGVMEHEIWLDADGDRVFAALTTVEGLDGWWGPVVQAEPRVGSVVEFDHGLGEPLRMEITELEPGARVVWRCVSEFGDPSNPASEWTGQTFTWEISPDRTVEILGTKRAATVLRLRVTGWPEPSRWYGFCNTAWGETLAGKLKSSCESTS